MDRVSLAGSVVGTKDHAHASAANAVATHSGTTIRVVGITGSSPLARTASPIHSTTTAYARTCSQGRCGYATLRVMMYMCRARGPRSGGM